MPEVAEIIPMKNAILDATNMVVTMMGQDFRPLDPGFLETVNSHPDNARSEHALESGSERIFTTEDVSRGGLIFVGEMYLSARYQGKQMGERIFSIGFKNPYVDYCVGISLDTNDMWVETQKCIAPFIPERYPAISQRVMASLAIVADELL